jgi:ABC-type oligopeptide transport system substrate-binding subunit/class 3 adenylate cyclase/DNA-binding beta-propeller fold protein YncE
MRDLPRGTVTLLFTDIEGSTRLLHSLGRERYVATLEAHRKLLREAATRHEGVEVDAQGDSFFFAFPYARDAVIAAAEGQLALARHGWDGPPVKVRMGVHTGEPTISDGAYAGLDVHRAARVMTAAHGGQVLLSARTTDFVSNELPDSIRMRRLGVYLLKDFDGGEPLAQLVVEGLPATFAAVRAEKRPLGAVRLVPRSVRKHPWVAAAGLVLVAGAAVGATFLFQSPAPKLESNALAELNARTGEILGAVPVGDTPVAVTAAGGSLWVANSAEATVSRVDPAQARVVRTISVPGTPVGVAVGGGSIWVVNSDLAAIHSTITRIDERYQRATATISLPSSILIGSGAGITWDGRNIWAVTQAGSAFRISGSSNRVTASVPVGDDPTSLVAAAGSVWVANVLDESVSRIQPPATVTSTTAVGSRPTAIAVGAGSLWVVDAGENAVRRLDAHTGSVLATITVGRNPIAVAASSDAVWVANSSDLSVTRIDPRTNRVTNTVALGYPPAALALANGRVWVALQKRQAAASRAKGPVLHLLTSIPGAIDSVDPPLAYTTITWDIEYATCAKLFNYPDAPAPKGYRIRPEIAESMPNVSDGGRTYTFTIRPGFRFSPPSGQEVTARTFKYSIERALAPGTKSFAVNFFSDIVGVRAYEQGRAPHISGVLARGKALVIKLDKPAGDLAARLAMPFFCPVPVGTPIDFKGLAGIPSAGPYYVASYVPNKELVLRRNPNYHGRRPHAAAAIDIRPVPTAEQAVRDVGHNRADAVLDLGGDTAIPAPYRSRFRSYREPDVRYIALNTSRPLFSSERERRAVALAIDRAAVTHFNSSWLPTESLLPKGFPGQMPQRAFPAKADLAHARRLAGRGEKTAIYLTCKRPACIQQATLVARELAPLGIHVAVKSLPESALFLKVTTPGAPYDITDSGWTMDYVDPADFLVPLATASGIKSAQSSNLAYFKNSSIEKAIARALPLQGAARARAFAAIEWRLRTQLVPYVALASDTRPILFSARVGCQLSNPAYGLDLGALCVRKD